MQNAIQAAPPSALLNEGLCKQLIAQYYRRIYSGERAKVVLHALLHEVYAQGVVAGRKSA